jgi:hypothetical protein
MSPHKINSDFQFLIACSDAWQLQWKYIKRHHDGAMVEDTHSPTYVGKGVSQVIRSILKGYTLVASVQALQN